MLDWLVAIQLPDGGFQGGVIGATPVRSVTFNTGQILIGLSAGVASFGDQYRPAMERAASRLVTNQDPDGCWRKGATPFAAAGEKAYETHVAWGLLEAARLAPELGFEQAALRNIHWALSKQRSNGWFESNCLNDPTRPLTHTIGYVLRGLLEAYRFSGDEEILRAARRTADGALTALRPDGSLPGRLDSRWTAAADYVCLTGSVQIAHCWLLLFGASGDERYLDAARKANSFVRRTVHLTGDKNIVGGVKGSFPVSGDYGRFEYLNWAAKFFVDANLLELDMTPGAGGV